MEICVELRDITLPARIIVDFWRTPQVYALRSFPETPQIDVYKGRDTQKDKIVFGMFLLA